jgi:hypothetical protein
VGVLLSSFFWFSDWDQLSGYFLRAHEFPDYLLIFYT